MPYRRSAITRTNKPPQTTHHCTLPLNKSGSGPAQSCEHQNTKFPGYVLCARRDPDNCISSVELPVPRAKPFAYRRSGKNSIIGPNPTESIAPRDSTGKQHPPAGTVALTCTLEELEIIDELHTVLPQAKSRVNIVRALCRLGLAALEKQKTDSTKP